MKTNAELIEFLSEIYSIKVFLQQADDALAAAVSRFDAVSDDLADLSDIDAADIYSRIEKAHLQIEEALEALDRDKFPEIEQAEEVVAH